MRGCECGRSLINYTPFGKADISRNKKRSKRSIKYQKMKRNKFCTGIRQTFANEWFQIFREINFREKGQN